MNVLSKGFLGMRRFTNAVVSMAIVAISIGVAAPGSAMALRHAFTSPSARGIVRDQIRTHGDVRDLGRLGSQAPVRIGVMMRYRHEDELQALTLAQGDRRSPYYHRYLTVDQWDNYFAPTETTYENVAKELERVGFHVEQTFRNRGMIRAVAPAVVAERYFHTTFHKVYQQRRGLRYMNVTPARMPLALRDSVISIGGLESVVGLHFPLHFSNRNHEYSFRHPVGVRSGMRGPVAAAATPTATPHPLTTATPGPNPSPDPTEVPDTPIDDFAIDVELGYGPPIFADAYDYPVQHGYGGTGHAAGSVIDSDFSDHDAALQFTTFGIKHTGKMTRVCSDPSGACSYCKDTAAAVSTDPTSVCDPEGESTLDAQAIMSLAPQADFYEYLVNATYSLDDVDVDGAYERVVSDDVVDAVNSSFGECETDDPSALYDENYIAMEGGAEGIMFSASAGDTGATSCGTYSANGTPQTAINASEPASAPYFTAVGGTSFQMLTSCTAPANNQSLATKTTCYTAEISWINGGGAVSVYEPQPSWQTALVAEGTVLPVGVGGPVVAASSGRDVPDIALTADPEMGVPLSVTYQGTTEGIGGTSLSSPMWVAMQTEIDQVQKSRNGFVNPRLYAVASSGSSLGTNGQYYTFAFRDIVAGNNVPNLAGPGYDLTTGIGSPLGWELAATE